MIRSLPALAAALVLPLAAHADCEMFRYSRVQPTPHVTVFQAAEGTTGVVNGNVVLVAGRDASLVVDTGQIPSVADRMVADIRALGVPPVRWIVHTHWHGDHIIANRVFLDAFPGAKIVAHSHTVERAAAVYADYPSKARTRLPMVIGDLRKRALEAKDEGERAYFARTAECGDALVGEIDRMQYVAPDTVVDGSMTIDLGGGITVDVRFLGQGNTPGDLVAWIASENVVATGDMVVAPVPYAIGSDLGPWVGTLDRVQALGARTLVPGHGPVMPDDAYLRDVRALIRSTREQLEALQARGVPKAEAAARIDPGPFAARYLTTPIRREAFEQFFLKAAVAKAYPPDPPPKPGS